MSVVRRIGLIGIAYVFGWFVAGVGIQTYIMLGGK
jgi:hypothetical protein